MNGTAADLGRPHRGALWPKRRASSASSKVIAEKTPWLNTFVSMEVRGLINVWNLQSWLEPGSRSRQEIELNFFQLVSKRSAFLCVSSQPHCPFSKLGLLTLRLQAGDRRIPWLAFDLSVWFHCYPHRYLAWFSFQTHLRNRRWDSRRLRFGFPRGPSEQAKLWTEPYLQLPQAEIVFPRDTALFLQLPLEFRRIRKVLEGSNISLSVPSWKQVLGI